LVAPLVVGRAEVAEGRVPPARVVEAFQVVKTAMRAWERVAKRWRSSSSHSRVAKKLSVMALSKQSPTEPMEATRPASPSRRPNASEVYWQPWMLP
jgi:hypothetical protein